MPAIAWLVVAVVAGAAAYLVGWPSWRSYRARETRDPTLSDTGPGVGPRLGRGLRDARGHDRDERRRISVAAALAAIAIAALIGFFVAG